MRCPRFVFQFRSQKTLENRFSSSKKRGRGWAAVTWKCHSALQAWTLGVTWGVTWCYLVLPGVLPGVTWSVTWCYLVPGRCLVLPGYSFGFFGGPKISAFLKLKLLEENQFPPRDVTWAHACSRYLFTWPTLRNGGGFVAENCLRFVDSD